MEVTDLLQSVSSTDSYLSFFLSKPLPVVFELFLLGLARIIPIIAFAPFLGAKALSDPMKVGFAIALVPIFLPLLLAHASGPIPLDITFILLLIKEAIVGFFLGFLLAVPFYFAQSAGALIDHQRGAQSLQVQDPTTQMQTSPTGILYDNMLLVIFFFIGGPFLFFEALASSYQMIPADQFFNASFFSDKQPIWHVIMRLFTTITSIALQLSAPSLITMLMTDLFLGIANRMAPQVQISFLLWSLKAYLGIAIIWAGWYFILKQLNVQTVSWLKMITKWTQTI